MASSGYTRVLVDAISRYRFPNGTGIKTTRDLLCALEFRFKTDRDLDNLFCRLGSILSPPSCTRSHCEHYTAFAVSCCADGKVPGRCPTHRKYRADKAARIIKHAVTDGKNMTVLYPQQDETWWLGSHVGMGESHYQSTEVSVMKGKFSSRITVGWFEVTPPALKKLKKLGIEVVSEKDLAARVKESAKAEGGK